MNCPYCRNTIDSGNTSCPQCGKYLGGEFSNRFSGQSQERAVPVVVDQASDIDRAEFIRRTYTHVAASVLIFIILETMLLNMQSASRIAAGMVRGYNWLIVLGVFMVVSIVADKWARSSTSRPVQYAGLGLYIVAEAIVFLPLLFVARYHSGPSVIGSAGLVTAALFGGLTMVVFTTKKDFSFLGGILKVGFFVAFGIIIAGIVFGFDLGLLFSGAMVALAAGMILYTTSAIMRDYKTDQYVAASLSLFASVMLLFWYILQIFLGLDD